MIIIYIYLVHLGSRLLTPDFKQLYANLEMIIGLFKTFMTAWLAEKIIIYSWLPPRTYI